MRDLSITAGSGVGVGGGREFTFTKERGHLNCPGVESLILVADWEMEKLEVGNDIFGGGMVGGGTVHITVGVREFLVNVSL